MKTKLILTLTVCLFGAATARADFIPLVLGYDYAAHGFHPPGALFKIIHGESRNTLSLFDSASPGHWNGFGVLPGGGTEFATDLINHPNGESTATVNWNFNGLPGYSMSYLDVVGEINGDPWESIYQITGATRFNSLSHLLVTINGDIDIEFLAFYGRWPGNVKLTPDSGSTVSLFLGSIVMLLGLHCLKRRLRNCKWAMV
jgi:hypothetical protein